MSDELLQPYTEPAKQFADMLGVQGPIRNVIFQENASPDTADIAFTNNSNLNLTFFYSTHIVCQNIFLLGGWNLNLECQDVSPTLYHYYQKYYVVIYSSKFCQFIS